jgi:hypothetical protein
MRNNRRFSDHIAKGENPGGFESVNQNGRSHDPTHPRRMPSDSSMAGGVPADSRGVARGRWGQFDCGGRDAAGDWHDW